MSNGDPGYIPACGDDLFTDGDTVLNKLSRWGTRYRGESPTLASHQAKFYDSTFIIEALMPGVVKNVWKQRRAEMDRKGVQWCVMRMEPELRLREQDMMQMWLDQMIGWKYSRAELVLCLMDGLLGKAAKKDVIFFRKCDVFRHRVICSKTANRVDVKLHLLPRKAYYWTPDDTWDYKVKHERWVIADHSMGWGKSR